tara:strand:+ start:712 stop:1008 length:297 start_codon:yes stop_codon:yes gene_type:complete
LIHSQRLSIPEHLILSTSGGIQKDLNRGLQLQGQPAGTGHELNPVSPTAGELERSRLSHHNLKHPLGLRHGVPHQLKPLLRRALLDLFQGTQGRDALV